ncbi:GntR family transcriptional regulator [Afifella marina]|uniref:DNA-binding transcriptional regulator, GntR family n=1 Tax=Afifella marina DSM 2698 TaxID=1120955 RepID=A0A1G5MW91_AFIMA|nr:GntR family transcriptional regulator [Afifella marina]SCZ29342.1 DNA-binding transcriptional regulator, GntR family [Afifella marina DSM 2698]
MGEKSRKARVVIRMDAQEEEVGPTSVEQATALIRRAIVTAEYRPGERLKVADAARRFGFSAMPVREALRKLEGEGLVAILPNRGAVIRPIDEKFLKDVYEVRTALETLAVQRLMPRITLAMLDELSALQAAHAAAVERADLEEIIMANRALHTRLFELAGNAEATRLFELGWELIYALRRRLGYRPNRLASVIEEHRLLVDALRRHDFAACAAILRMHNTAGMEDMIASLSGE